MNSFEKAFKERMKDMEEKKLREETNNNPSSRYFGQEKVDLFNGVSFAYDTDQIIVYDKEIKVD